MKMEAVQDTVFSGYLDEVLTQVRVMIMTRDMDEILIGGTENPFQKVCADVVELVIDRLDREGDFDRWVKEQITERRSKDNG